MIFEASVGATAFGGGRKNNGWPKAYYHSSVAANGYTSNYDAGRAYWNQSYIVTIGKTTSTANRPDIYYIGNTSIPGVIGQFTPYNSLGNPVTVNSYWDYTTVFMYDNQMRALSNYTTLRINYNAAHEIGHTVKMAHPSSVLYLSVMAQGWNDLPYSIRPYDLDEVNKKW